MSKPNKEQAIEYFLDVFCGPCFQSSRAEAYNSTHEDLVDWLVETIEAAVIRDFEKQIIKSREMVGDDPGKLTYRQGWYECCKMVLKMIEQLKS
jgi:hypothetical protein